MQPWRYFKHFFIPGAHNNHRPRILHRPWLIFFLATILLTEGFLVSNLIARQSDQQFLAAVVPADVIALTNSERSGNKLNGVTEDALLDKAAQAKANDMAANGYFSHTGPDGKTPWQWIAESGYQYQYAGENLAVRFIDSKDVVNAWMMSPTHRANIVKPVYTQIGVGVAEGMYDGQPATYVVQYFGTPKTAQAAAAVTVAPSNTVAAVTTPVAVASQTVPAAPSVQGAEVSPAPAPTPTPAAEASQSNSFMQSIGRQLVRAFSNPQQTSNLVLGLVATLLTMAVLFTFFVHIQIQHPGMLAAGAFVAVLALFFLSVNTRLVGGVGQPQSASVLTAAKGVVVTAEAADTGYALFP